MRVKDMIAALEDLNDDLIVVFVESSGRRDVYYVPDFENDTEVEVGQVFVGLNEIEVERD